VGALNSNSNSGGSSSSSASNTTGPNNNNNNKSNGNNNMNTTPTSTSTLLINDLINMHQNNQQPFLLDSASLNTLINPLSGNNGNAVTALTNLLSSSSTAGGVNSNSGGNYLDTAGYFTTGSSNGPLHNYNNSTAGGSNGTNGSLYHHPIGLGSAAATSSTSKLINQNNY
jgi:hypothetical protein